eukprot:403345367
MNNNNSSRFSKNNGGTIKDTPQSPKRTTKMQEYSPYNDSRNNNDSNNESEDDEEDYQYLKQGRGYHNNQENTITNNGNIYRSFQNNMNKQSDMSNMQQQRHIKQQTLDVYDHNYNNKYQKQDKSNTIQLPQQISHQNQQQQQHQRDKSQRQQRYLDRKSKTRQQSQSSDDLSSDRSNSRKKQGVSQKRQPSTTKNITKEHNKSQRVVAHSPNEDSYNSDSSSLSSLSDQKRNKNRQKSTSKKLRNRSMSKKALATEKKSIQPASIASSHAHLHHHNHQTSTIQSKRQTSASKKTVKKKDKEGGLDKKSESTLVQRLLMDITEKYKGLNNAQSSCYINKLEKKTMVHEINVLAKALIKTEKKYIKSVESGKGKVRELKKQVKQLDQVATQQDLDINSMQEHIRGLRQSEEHLMSDLVKQQKIAKDSLRALDNLSDKYDKEKRELIFRLEKEKDDALKREEAKYEVKVNSIKALNEQLNSKLGTLHETEDDFSALQKNYNEAVGIIEDQKRELQSALHQIDDLRVRNGTLEDEVKDIQGMLQEQQKIYSSHINELRVQLNELEEATRTKYEEQIVALQLDLKMKQDQLNRQMQEREMLERKMKNKIEEVGASSKQKEREVKEKEEEKEELVRMLKNQEYELERLKRIIQNKDEELEQEKKRFQQKHDRKSNEHEREKQEWNDMYQALQREIQGLKQTLQEKDNQLQLTLRRSVDGGLGGLGSFKSSIQQSPNGNKFINIEGGNNNQVIELQEQLKTKEEEIKILWNVIKEINKSKGTEKVNIEQLKHAISQKVTYPHSQSQQY